MSLFTSGLLPPGLIRPATEGGGTDYYNEKKTKISVITNPAVNPSYGIYKTYSNAPPTPNERDGNTATVVQQPRTVELSISDVFNPGNAEMEALTQYFSRVVPSKVKSTRAAITIGRFGVKQLLEQFLRSKLQEDMEVVEARMAGATDVERELAMARMQDRYSDMIRNYGTDQRVRQALLRQFIGRIDDPALRQALTRDIRHAEATLGTSTMSLNPGVVSTEGEAMAELDRSAYYDEVGSEMGETEIDYAGAGEEGETLIQPGEDEMVDEQPLLQPEESLIPDIFSGSREPALGRGLDSRDGGASIPVVSVGSYVPPTDRETSIRGVLGSTRPLREIAPVQAPSAPATAVASQDENGAGAYREEEIEIVRRLARETAQSGFVEGHLRAGIFEAETRRGQRVEVGPPSRRVSGGALGGRSREIEQYTAIFGTPPVGTPEQQYNQLETAGLVGPRRGRPTREEALTRDRMARELAPRLGISAAAAAPPTPRGRGRGRPKKI